MCTIESDPCSRSDNIKVQKYVVHLTLPICVSKMRVLGVLTPKMSSSIDKTSKLDIP